MKQFLKILIPLLLVAALIISLGWYFLQYDRDFTRDILVSAAQRQEARGNHSFAHWIYGLAYRQSSYDGSVAIELAQQYLSQGNYTKAEYTLSNAIANGSSVDLYIALCSVYVAQDKLLDAVTMLEQIADPAIKAELDAMRPAAPQFTPDPGFYSQYMTVSVSSAGCALYVSQDGEYPSRLEDSYTEPIVLNQGETTLYALGVAENGLVSPITIASYTVGGIVEPVSFADPVMETAVRTLLGNANQTIFSNELWVIEELAFDQPITDWSDLQYFTGLKKLTVPGITSLSFLPMVPQLEALCVSGSNIPGEELENLAACPGLSSLDLSDCQLSTLSGLETLTRLTQLKLGNNSLRNLSPISGLANLSHLELQHNAVDDLSDLKALTELRYLDVSYNSVSSLVPLQSFARLEHLDLGHNAIGMADRLSTLGSLTWLNLEHNYLMDVTPLKSLTDLGYLNLSHNSLSDITSLSSLTKLQTFHFAGNTVEKLPAWPTNCALVTLDGSNNQLESVEELAGLESLNAVIVDYNKLTDISCLADCPLLVSVDAFGNEIPEVAKLLSKNIVVRYDPTQRSVIAGEDE